jgi:transketolase N-terminal domain/subunit
VYRLVGTREYMVEFSKTDTCAEKGQSISTLYILVVLIFKICTYMNKDLSVQVGDHYFFHVSVHISF